MRVYKYPMSNAATAPVTVNRSTVIHLGTLRGGRYGVDCGAVRFRNTTAATITRRPAGTEVTCTKCRKAAGLSAAADARPAYYGKPINTPADHRWAGLRPGA